jgi:hypothetical protein
MGGASAVRSRSGYGGRAACCNYLLPPVYGESHYSFFSGAYRQPQV